jgi:hypothetical protein
MTILWCHLIHVVDPAWRDKTWLFLLLVLIVTTMSDGFYYWI